MINLSVRDGVFILLPGRLDVGLNELSITTIQLTWIFFDALCAWDDTKQFSRINNGESRYNNGIF